MERTKSALKLASESNFSIRFDRSAGPTKICRDRYIVAFGALAAIVGLVILGLAGAELTSTAGASTAQCQIDDFQASRDDQLYALSKENYCKSTTCPLVVKVVSPKHGILYVNNWSPEFIASVNDGGEVKPLRDEFRCCPSLADCCGFQRDVHFCDDFGPIDPDCPSGPWDCYFLQLDALLATGNPIPASELRVGNPHGAWPALIVGLVLSVGGLSILLCMTIRRYRKNLLATLKSFRKQGTRQAKTAPSRVTWLRRVPFLHGVPEAELTILAQTLREVTFGEGEYIYHQGDEGGPFYVLCQGSVVLDTTGKEVARLFAGSDEQLTFFGENRAHEKVPRPSSALVLSPARVWVLDGDKVIKFRNAYGLSGPRYASLAELAAGYAESRCDRCPFGPPPPMLLDLPQRPTSKAEVIRPCSPADSPAALHRLPRAKASALPGGAARIEVELDPGSPPLGADLLPWSPPAPEGQHARPANDKPYVAITRVVPFGFADILGLQQGDLLMQAGAMIWPSAGASEMLGAVLEAPRPLALVFERPPGSRPGTPSLAEGTEAWTVEYLPGGVRERLVPSSAAGGARRTAADDWARGPSAPSARGQPSPPRNQPHDLHGQYGDDQAHDLPGMASDPETGDAR
mmetsp:Transcript_61622/g.133406  ORF Transcript_61622/g.133406 Transcript_61622/m.133406 type:complete len:632 (-) Transcript_61622:102-1997(-)